MSKQKPRTVKLVEEVKLCFGGNMIDAKQGQWFGPNIFIRCPAGTEFNLVKESSKAYTVEMDFNSVALGFSLRKSSFEKPEEIEDEDKQEIVHYRRKTKKSKTPLMPVVETP